jgi:hypothetical protein
MAKALTEIRSLARSHTRSAIGTLAHIMRRKDAPPAARVAAAKELLDRGWGKPVQAFANGEEGALQLIHRIERVIVDASSEDADRPDIRADHAMSQLQVVNRLADV